MAAMSIYGKSNFKRNLVLRNEMADIIGTWYTDWALKSYLVCSKDDPRLTFDVWIQMSTFVPYTFVCENTKTVDYSETIEAYGINILYK